MICVSSINHICRLPTFSLFSTVFWGWLHSPLSLLLFLCTILNFCTHFTMTCCYIGEEVITVWLWLINLPIATYSASICRNRYVTLCSYVVKLLADCSFQHSRKMNNFLFWLCVHPLPLLYGNIYHINHLWSLLWLSLVPCWTWQLLPASAFLQSNFSKFQSIPEICDARCWFVVKLMSSVLTLA